MKKILALWLLLTLLLCGCAESGPAMYIRPAELTEEELAIVDLMGIDMERKIYDFKVDETVQRISINAYELIDGKWDLFFGGGGRVFTDTEGRMLLDFENLEEGLRESIQSENCNGSTSWKSDAWEDLSGTQRATSLLAQQTEIVYEQEIPLAVQIVTTKNEIRSYDPSFFFHPEDYEKYGYDHVYAVTVLFSQEPLS